MRTLLLLFSVLVSLCLVVFSYLALTNQIGTTLFILVSLAVSVFFVFAAGHAFSELHLAKKSFKKANASQNNQAKAHEDEIKRLTDKISALEKQLQEAQTASAAIAQGNQPL